MRPVVALRPTASDRAVSHARGRGRHGVHMLPLTKAMEVSGSRWLHVVCVSARCGVTPQPLTNFKIV